MQKDALVAAIKSQADRAYEAWQSAAYRRTQALAAQPGAPPAKDFVRYTLKGAHFLELMQKWCARHIFASSRCTGQRR